ncbi:MAG: DNA-processing protein DprA [bacterium]
MGRDEGHEILVAVLLAGVRPASKVARLLRRKSLEGVEWADMADLAGEMGLAAEEVAALARVREIAVGLCRTLRRSGVAITALGEPGYPALLAEIAVPPPVVYVKGSLEAADANAVAIVGSRKPSLAGFRMAVELAGDLARAGFTIVSGLARGIDTAAHRGALEAGGRTIAVLGSGIDVTYPPENKSLAESVAAHGALLSEFVPGSRPLKGNFPRRNRLISGLSLGTVVVEAGERSGALITADAALEQNRTVFAVPGNPGYAGAKGANRLLKEGAKLVESAADVLEDISAQVVPRADQAVLGLAPCLTRAEEQVAGLLSDAPVHVDEVSRHLGMPADTVLAVLLSLETMGLVRPLPGKFYVREAGR